VSVPSAGPISGIAVDSATVSVDDALSLVESSGCLAVSSAVMSPVERPLALYVTLNATVPPLGSTASVEAEAGSALVSDD